AGRVVRRVGRLVAEGVTVSVDACKPGVARAELEAGAAMINDVSGLADPEIAELCAPSGAALVIMHTRAEPKQAQFPDYEGDVVGDVLRFLAQRAALTVGRGVGAQQIVLDPGPDFAKRPEDTIALLRNLRRTQAL